MKSIYKIGGIVSVVLLLAACGATDPKARALQEKKEKYEKLKQQQTDISNELTKLEKEIAKLDTSAARVEKPKLVALTALQPGTFTHYIDLQGKVDAENIAWVTPRGQGGQVRAIYVKQGDYVRKGQLLVKLDDAVQRQQIEQLNVQMNLAKTTYERRKNLWDQKIGTEMELIKAKNDVENLQKNIDILKEQLDMTNVYAQISGVADQVTIKIGETFSPASATQMGIRIVNTANLKVTANVPENYQSQVKEGSNVVITLPEDRSKQLNAKINVAGKTIDPISRSFYIEAHIPGNKDFRPGQIALVRIQDYAANNTITIPLATIQNDEKGKYVMVAATENGKQVARKRSIVIGQMYNDRLEVKSGLQAGDQLITEGFQGLYDGQLITTDTK